MDKREEKELLYGINRGPVSRLMRLYRATAGRGVSTTVTGSIVSVSNALHKKLEKLAVNFSPVQSGSGDPSPDNIRPISGWTGVNAYVGASQSDYDTYPASFGSTYYGGQHDLVSGALTSEWAIVDLGTLSWGKYTNSNSEAIFHADISDGASVVANGREAYCTAYARYAHEGSGTWYNNIPDKNFVCCASGVSNSPKIWIRDDSCADTASFKTAMSGVMLAYPLATPLTLSLTPQDITAPAGGDMTVWSDGDSVEVTYKASAS